MVIDRMTIKSLIFKQCKKIIEYLTYGGHSGTIDDLVTDAVEVVLKYETEERQKRRCNIPEDTDLTTDRYDKTGTRRFSLRCIDDEPVMMPDEEGFWTPYRG